MSQVASNRVVLRIPRSDLILVLFPRGGVSPESIEAILRTADGWAARQISRFGADAPTDFILDYPTGEDPMTRLLIWSTLDKRITWGELKAMIDGLWTYLVDRMETEYCYWEIYETTVDEESQLGYGAIMETHRSSTRPFHRIDPRTLQIIPSSEQTNLNASDPPSK